MKKHFVVKYISDEQLSLEAINEKSLGTYLFLQFLFDPLVPSMERNRRID